MRATAMVAAVLLAAGLTACSRSNNLLFGRVEALVAGHPVVVTDCYRTRVPSPQPQPDGVRFTPCRDADVVIRSERLTVNGVPYGELPAGARVVVDHGRVSVEK
jgi:hypothetical protein